MNQIRDIYQAYQEMERSHIIVSFKGIITKELLDSVYQIIDSRMEFITEDLKKRKRVYNILIESLQNIYHHMDDLMTGENNHEIKSKDAMFMVIRGEDGSYNIQTGNYILSSKCEILKSRIEHINSLSADELRIFYIDKLSSSEFSEKGGAGLGFIDIARKSGNKLIYGFNTIDDKYSFFSLMISIS